MGMRLYFECFPCSPKIEYANFKNNGREPIFFYVYDTFFKKFDIKLAFSIFKLLVSIK